MLEVACEHLVARIGRLASGAGRCRTTAPFLTLGPLPCRSKPKRLVAITFRSSGLVAWIGGAPSTCAAAVEAIRAAWAGCPDGYAKAATPVTSAQVRKAWVRAARYSLAGTWSRRR